MRWSALLLAFVLSGCFDGAYPPVEEAPKESTEHGADDAQSLWRFSCDDPSAKASVESDLMGRCASGDGRATFLLPSPSRVETIQADVRIQPVSLGTTGPYVRLQGSADSVVWENLDAAGSIEDPLGIDDRTFTLAWEGSMKMVAFRVVVNGLYDTAADGAIDRTLLVAAEATVLARPAPAPAPVQGECMVIYDQTEAPGCVSGSLHIHWIPAPLEPGPLRLRVSSSHLSQVTCPSMPEQNLLLHFPVRAFWSAGDGNWTELDMDYVATGYPGGDWHESDLRVDHAIWFVGMAVDPVVPCPAFEPRLSASMWRLE